MKRKSALKGIASYDKVIEEHKEKIMEEKRKPSPNMEVVKYWEKEIKKFWSKQLNMPISQFRKTKIVKSKNKKIYDNPQDYHGTFTFSVIKSADLCYKILGQIYGMMTAI